LQRLHGLEALAEDAFASRVFGNGVEMMTSLPRTSVPPEVAGTGHHQIGQSKFDRSTP